MELEGEGEVKIRAGKLEAHSSCRRETATPRPTREGRRHTVPSQLPTISSPRGDADALLERASHRRSSPNAACMAPKVPPPPTSRYIRISQVHTASSTTA